MRSVAFRSVSFHSVAKPVPVKMRSLSSTVSTPLALVRPTGDRLEPLDFVPLRSSRSIKKKKEERAGASAGLRPSEEAEVRRLD